MTTYLSTWPNYEKGNFVSPTMLTSSFLHSSDALLESPVAIASFSFQCISDEEILGDEEVRLAALSKLDANGWSTEGTFRRVLWTRVWMLGSIIREEVLELYLGSDVDDSSVHARVE
jgi:hypothetical protein